MHSNTQIVIATRKCWHHKTEMRKEENTEKEEKEKQLNLLAQFNGIDVIKG